MQTLRSKSERTQTRIGVLFGGSNLQGDDFQNVVAVQKREFSLGMNYIGMVLTQPEEGKFNFFGLDFFARTAKENSMASLGHPLIWGNSVPNWLKAPKFQVRSALMSALTNHIETLVGRHAGEVESWVVVNEYRNPTADLFYDVIGPDYVELAFATARKADPGAKLLYNDYSNHLPAGDRTPITHSVVDALHAKKLIDAVGLQMHLFDDAPLDKAAVIATMRSYNLPVFVTEFDVNLRKTTGSRDERFAIQAARYRTALTAALESGVCDAFVVFGCGTSSLCGRTTRSSARCIQKTLTQRHSTTIFNLNPRTLRWEKLLMISFGRIL